MNENGQYSILIHPGPQEKDGSPKSIPTPSASLKNSQGQKESIIQETKILQQILGRFPDRGNQINVINIGQIVENGSAKTNGINGSGHSFDLGVYLDSFPPPRLQNMILSICQQTEKRFPSQEKAAAYLGISRRILAYKLNSHPKIGGFLARPKIQGEEKGRVISKHPAQERKATGRQLSEETKRKMAEARRNYWKKKKAGEG